MKRFLAAFLIILVLVLLDSQARSELYEVREIHYQMGTLLDITIWHPDREDAKRILRRSVQEVHRLEGILSHYDPQSALSLLNRQAGQGKVKTDLELFQILAIAIDFSIKTSGYFDVTVGPLLGLWRQAAEKGSMPDPHALAQAVELVGYRNLRLYHSGEVELVHRGMMIDLGGIGKGYAVDRIVEIFRQARVRTALINFGGSSIYALGNPPGEDSWKIGLQGTNGRWVGTLHLRDRALSTSGSMGRSWKIGGKRYGHLINPKNGLPATETRLAVVTAPTATEAEALTKPLILLEKKEMTLIKRFSQAEALLISETAELELSNPFFPITFFERTQTR